MNPQVITIHTRVCLFLQGSWEKKIIERINNQKSKASRKRPRDEETTPKSKRGRPKLSATLSRYPPLDVTDGDDVTQSRNLGRLNTELTKDKPSKEVILPLVRQTFLARREAVLSSEDSIEDLLTEYPVLKLSYVVSDNKYILSMLCIQYPLPLTIL